MRLRIVGKSGLEIPPIILGGMFRNPAARLVEIEFALDCALDLGLFAIDTAPLYEFGESERLLGRFVKDRRARMCLMTKVGLRWDDDWGDVLFETQISGRKVAVRRDSRAQAIRRDVEESLIRLRCESLDLVQIHHRDPHTPISETMGELVRLQGEGKLRAIGVSNFSAEDLVEAHKMLGPMPLASTQNDFSLIERTPEQSVLPAAREYGVGLLAYSPLAQGLLAGRLLDRSLPDGDGRMQGALFQPGNLRQINHVLREVAIPIAERLGGTLSEVALAWVVAQEGVSAAIVGAQTAEQVRVAAAAVDVELSREECDELCQAFKKLSLDRNAGVSLYDRLRAKVGRRVRRILG